ncbi:MAG: hypothetical protein ABL929_07245 [Ferruginibacter sp.]|nr:hypothetical protein [Ferruginibacter sp.]
MIKKRPNWISNPSKRHVILISLLWFSGIFLSIVTITNVFTQTPFQQKNTLMWIVQLCTTATYIQVLRNYFKK